jgi:hypothetical protein
MVGWSQRAAPERTVVLVRRRDPAEIVKEVEDEG